jgi:peptidoglycan-N-acetylglucosamine deacetylase
MFFLHKSIGLFRWFYPHFLWKKNNPGKVIYLTFDDGPIPEVTPFVLETLAQFGAKATFFCIGDNVGKHPDIFQQILEGQHRVGNHTFHHLNGWQTDTDTYVANVAKCQASLPTDSPERPLFRPPYGRISRAQARALMPTYDIVMWDVLTGDFSPHLSAENCWHKTQRYTEAGSIVVFHDSLKAEAKLRYVLPRFLAYFSQKGYRFEVL